MARLTASLFLVWALLLGPALCVGGLLSHACDCEGQQEMQCEHEDSCSMDPCSGLANLRDHEQTALDDVVPWIPVAILRWEAELDSTKWSWPALPPPPPDRWNLPYAQSDRPLLI